MVDQGEIRDLIRRCRERGVIIRTWVRPPYDESTGDGVITQVWVQNGIRGVDQGWMPVCQAAERLRAFLCDEGARTMSDNSGPETPLPQPAVPAIPSDTTLVKCHIMSCITALRDEDGRVKTRELSLAVTKLQEAVMWIDEHQRLS